MAVSTPEKTAKLYAKREHELGRDRHHFWNREVLLQTLAYDASVISALRSIDIQPSEATILDVGCGEGGSIVNYLRLGFDPSKIYGIDILEDRIQSARKKLPHIHFVLGDASEMDMFKEGQFDIVTGTGIFLAIPEEALAVRIAQEMLRIVKHGGHIVLAEWRYNKPGSFDYTAVTRKRISALFNVGTQSLILAAYKGELVPPVGRFLSKHSLDFIYFGLRFAVPFLVGQKATVLQKL